MHVNCFFKKVGIYRIIEADQNVSRIEVSLDDICSYVIAKRQLTVNDLCAVVVTLKIITDLEHIGDEAIKIVRTTKNLYNFGPIGFLNHYESARELTSQTAESLQNTLHGFACLPGKRAKPCKRQSVSHLMK